LAPGVDALLFNPYPEQPKRAIDLYSIGRRSEITHQKLLQLASDARFFYLHDSIRGSQAINPAQHRTLFANIAKRSRYFIVNPGLIDDPKTRGNQSEIGNRYFEGAASGTIMVGERPQNEEFEKLFDWPDALIDMPYDSSEIDWIIQELDRQPERQERIRQNNVAHALLRHDWAYRWGSILQIAGLAPMPQLLERKERLQGLGQAVLEGNMARTSA
jgi:spore maturation protein CgeB